ncbi:hypothetical protein [Mycobacterium intracellulare]|nr:hypothetical protein [Mycobacterium intracellulare]UCN12822.1 hypothetical protein LFT50_28265 [Mycobacterium intracellulare subsp. chimaera]
MTSRERIENEACESGWTLEAIGVGDAVDDLVRVSRSVPVRSAVLSFSKSGELFYADGQGINVASITIGAAEAVEQVITYLRQS